MAGALLVTFVFGLAMAADSNAAVYCLCKDGVSQSALQKTLDYACGDGADCSAILQTGGCYNPNTVKNHCDYAVNSYFQRKGQVTGSCDFNGAATTSSTVPTQPSGCTYQSSAGSMTPTTSTNTGFLSPPGIPSGTGLEPNSYSDTSAAIKLALHYSPPAWFCGLLLLVLVLGQWCGNI